MEQFDKDFGPTRAGFFEYLCNGFYSRCEQVYSWAMGHWAMDDGVAMPWHTVNLLYLCFFRFGRGMQ